MIVKTICVWAKRVSVWSIIFLGFLLTNPFYLGYVDRKFYAKYQHKQVSKRVLILFTPIGSKNLDSKCKKHVEYY